MDFHAREALLRRITCRKLYGYVDFLHNKYSVIITDPTLDILCEADWLYKSKLDEYSDKGGMTLEESYNLLQEQNLWTKKYEQELETLTKNVKDLRLKLPTLKFIKSQQRVTKNAITKAKERINELYTIKNQYWPHTIDHICLLEKRKFILSKITTIDIEQMLNNNVFLNRLSVYYYEENSIPECNIRELARTDPWRLYWTVSKETGTSLFRHSSVEMTELQYALVTWSRIYDFAYESQHRPQDDVISDDDSFDAWYETECSRIKSEVSKNTNDSFNSNSGLGVQETFIPADEEGAKEVYSLNNIDARVRIAQREKALNEKGTLTEANLPDVKRDLQMAANRINSK